MLYSTPNAHDHDHPFDAALSLTIDCILIELDTGASGLRRRYLKLRKWWYELRIPAQAGEVAL